MKLASGLRKQRGEFGVARADGHDDKRAARESQYRAAGSRLTQPVAEQDDPGGADHRAETQ